MSSVLADMRQARQHANASMLSNNSSSNKAAAQSKVAAAHQSTAAKAGSAASRAVRVAADSQSVLQRIYAKYDDADAVLDANMAAHTPTGGAHGDKHAAARARPPSPGLSPIHMGALHSPFAAAAAAKGRVATADADLHHQCDHSIHSIRPDGLMAQAHACCGSGHRHSAAATAEKRHSSTDTTVSSMSSATNGSIVSSNGGISRDSSMRHSPANAHAHPHSQTQTNGVTRPADLYGAEAERADFFALMQRLWADHVANKPAGGATLQGHPSRPGATSAGSGAQVHPHPTSERARSVTRSTSTTLASTPGSSSIAQSNASTPERSGSVASGSGSAAASAAGESSFAVWERQILAWEARLCAWKNAQEAALSARVVELERARTSMEAQMSAQEALYERRQTKLRSAVAALDERKAAFARDVETNSQREAQLRALLVSRQAELERREAKFAKLRRDCAESSGSGSAASVDEAAMLQRLTLELSASFEAREKQLAESYAAKARRLEEELAANRAREKGLRDLQSQAADLAAKAEARAAAQARDAEARVESRIAERTRALEAEWASRLDAALAARVSQLESAHTAALLSAETTWQARSDAWFAQKLALQTEAAALKSAAAVAAEKAGVELARLRGEVEAAQMELQQLRSAPAAAAAAAPSSTPALQQAQPQEAHHSAEVRARMTEQFDAELSSLRAQHDAELSEMAQSHGDTVREMEQALLAAADRERAANALATQLRAAIASLQQQHAAAEFALAEARAQIPAPVSRATAAAQTEPAADPVLAGLQGDLQATQHLLAQKQGVVAALQSELDSTHRAHADDKARLENAHAAAVAAAADRAAQELGLVREEWAAKLAAAATAHEASVDALRSEFAARESLRSDTAAAQAAADALMAEREELQRRQVDDLVRREEELQRRALEHDTRALELEQAHSLAVQAFQEESVAARARLAESQAGLDARAADLDARTVALEAEEARVAAERSRLEGEVAAGATSRAEFEARESRHNALHAANLRQVSESQASVDKSFKQLRAAQASLKEEKAEHERLAAALATDRGEALQWRHHLEQRDAELSAAVAAFEAHVSAREAAAAEWESRLRAVEARYQTEFDNVSGEGARLTAWERELLEFQEALVRRENHLAIVERNLHEYLSPFDESVVGSVSVASSAGAAAGNAGAAAADASMHQQQQQQQLQALQPATPLKLSPQSLEARRMLQHTLSTPIALHRYRGSPFAPGNSALYSSAANAASATATAAVAAGAGTSPSGASATASLASSFLGASLALKHATTHSSPNATDATTPPKKAAATPSSTGGVDQSLAAPSPVASLYSPTQADISLQLTDQQETSFVLDH